MAKSDGSHSHAVRDFVAYVLLRCAAFVVGLLPERVAVWFGRFVGRMFWRLSPKRRERVVENIRRAMPGELSEEEIQRLARESFTHMGLTIVETLWADRRARKKGFFDGRFPVEGLETVKAELAKGTGAVAATLHLGNWEVFGGRLAHGLGTMAVVALQGKNRRVSDYIVRTRERMGLHVISSDDGARPMVRAIKNGSLLAVLIDRHVKVAGARTTFFGRDVSTTTIVAALARRLDVPVFIGYSVREGHSFRHRGLVEGPLELAETDDREADTLVNTQRFNDYLEAAVRRFPAQWLWVLKRWRLANKLEAGKDPESLIGGKQGGQNGET